MATAWPSLAKARRGRAEKRVLGLQGCPLPGRPTSPAKRRARPSRAACYPLRMRFRLTVLLLAAAAALAAARFTVEQTGRIARLSDPQIAPDGASIAVVVSRTNYEENRYDPELVLIDVSTRAQRVVERGRRGLSQARWSPDGTRLAFLASVDGKPQIFVMPMSGGSAWQVTKSPTAVQQYAWRPGHAEIAYVAADEPPKVTGEERHNRAFEIQNNHYLLQEAPRPAHVWLISADGKGPAAADLRHVDTAGQPSTQRAVVAAHVVARWLAPRPGEDGDSLHRRFRPKHHSDSGR